MGKMWEGTWEGGKDVGGTWEDVGSGKDMGGKWEGHGRMWERCGKDMGGSGRDLTYIQ